MPKMARVCGGCGHTFVSIGAHHRFCSDTCRYRVRDKARWPGGGQQHSVLCAHCREGFGYTQVTKPRKYCDPCSGREQ